MKRLKTQEWYYKLFTMTGAKLLIVDDDADERIIVKELLEEQHFHAAHYFEDGHSVLAYLHQIKEDALLPRTIITDINMPAMSGLKLLALLKENKRFSPIKVIVLSTGGMHKYGDECIRLGAAAYFEKPNTYTEMKKLVNYFTFL